ncbi:MAG: membrane protein insertase YidC [Lentisphaerota bacterium]
MKKSDMAIVAVLFALWIFWPTLDRQISKRFFPNRVAKTSLMATQAVSQASAEAKSMPADAAFSAKPETLQLEAEKEAVAPATEPAQPREPERTASISNEKLQVTLSSRGGTVVSAVLKAYRQTIDPESAPVDLDFNACRALAVINIPGLSDADDFAMTPVDDRTVQFERQTTNGLLFRRTVALESDYLLKVSDSFVNQSASPVVLSDGGLQMGCMRNLSGDTIDKGVVYLGVDTLSPGGDGVQNLGKGFAKWFGKVQKENNLAKLPVTVDWPVDKPVDWMAVKNKYFVQILTPEGGSEKCMVDIRRRMDPREASDPEFKPKMTEVEEVSAVMIFAEAALEPGATLARSLQFYIGPKKYSELSRFGMHQIDVMEFGFWQPVGKVLLIIMNWIHDHIWPFNYGVAIMLLTIIIRIVFWPITRKSTESMKKMQAIQPLMTEVRAKFKDDPQKQQKAVMALYKEHKVNPLGGCLPMLVQIPVFIALFVVLRSAIELRFASFLWIHDLSSAERLFAGILPIPLNILPLLMAATMAWQQRLTPTGGDPQQQKIMMFMPLMMLVFFYNFAAGLSLYWTTNQVLMIVQLLAQKKKPVVAVAG